MGFRDDRQSLRNRVDELATELAEKERELAKAREDDAEAEKLRARVKELEASRAEARDEPPVSRATSNGRVVAIVIFGVAIGPVFVAVMMLADRKPGPPSVVSAAPAAPASTLPKNWRGLEYVPEIAEVRFPAKALFASGMPVAEGDACHVLVRVQRGSQFLPVEGLKVVCGERVLYEKKRPAGGFPDAGHLNVSATEWPGPTEGTYRYSIAYSDEEPAPNALHARIRPLEGNAYVWTESTPVTIVHLDVDQLSEPRAGEKLNADALGYPESRGYATFVRRTGKVLESSDPSFVEPGKRCVVALLPLGLSSGADCRVVAYCDPRGLSSLAKNGAVFRSCSPDGRYIPGDEGVKLDLDLDKNRVAFEATVGLRVQRVVIALDPQPTTPAK